MVKLKKELEDKLFRKYPTIFPNGRDVNTKTSLMCFGISIKDGWYDLIDKLCADIIKIPQGRSCIAAQVKEKFGGLRFYVNGTTKDIHKLINKAEKDSFTICEECGKKGTLTNLTRWYRTICKECIKND